MPRVTLPASVRTQLEKEGYSKKMMAELSKWYYPSQKKHVAK